MGRAAAVPQLQSPERVAGQRTKPPAASRPSALQRHPGALLEHAPKGMAAADGAALRGDPRVRDAFTE